MGATSSTHGESCIEIVGRQS